MFVGSAFTVGRQDFSIRSMDPLTGKERWNVTYSRLGINGSPTIASKGMLAPFQPSVSCPICYHKLPILQSHQGGQCYVQLRRKGVSPLAELLGLEIWNQGMTLGLRNPKTGVKSWEAQFVMPVISAFLPSGAEVPLSQASAPALALPEAPEGAGSHCTLSPDLR